MTHPNLAPYAVIPAPVRKAAEGFGLMIAQGTFEREDALHALCAAAVEQGYQGDPIGLSVNLSMALTAAALKAEASRDRAPWTIRKCIEPLLRAWAPLPEVILAANAENQRLGRPLLYLEVLGIVETELSFFLRSQRGVRRRRVG